MLPRKTPRFRLTKATAPALEPRSGAQHRPKAPTRASPGVAKPRLDAEFLPAGAVDVETHKAEHDCLYDAIRAGLLEQGVSQVPGDAKGMRRVVMEACQNRSTGAFKLETCTLAQTLRQDGNSLLGLAARTQKAGKPGWGGTEEMVVLANKFATNIASYLKAGRTGYTRLTLVRPAVQTDRCIRLLFADNCHYNRLRNRAPVAPAPKPAPAPKTAPAPKRKRKEKVIFSPPEEAPARRVRAYRAEPLRTSLRALLTLTLPSQKSLVSNQFDPLQMQTPAGDELSGDEFDQAEVTTSLPPHTLVPPR